MGLMIQHLIRKRKNFMLQDISFSLPKGYILGVIGRNGSGKTTFFETLLSGLCPDGGTVTIDQTICNRASTIADIQDSQSMWSTQDTQEIQETQEAQEEKDQRMIEYRKQFAFVLENCPYPEEISAKDMADLFGEMYTNFDEKGYLKRLQQLDVPVSQSIKKMSQGTKLKLQMAFAFSYDSKVLLLDEPSAHLDTFARKELYQMIYTYMEDGEHSVIWATHLTDELDRMADYLLLLESGKMRFFDEKDKILGQYRVVKGNRRQLDCMRSQLIGRTDRETYSEGLVKANQGPFPLADQEEEPTIEQLLCYLYDSKKK